MADPATIAAIASLAISAGKAVASGVAKRKASKPNRDRIKELEAQQSRDELGLSDRQRAALEGASVLPARAQGAETRRRAAAQSAIGGSTSAAQQQALRQEETAISAGAEQRAARDIEELDLRQRQAREQELAQRLQARGKTGSDNVAGTFDDVSDVANSVGELLALEDVGLLGLDKTIQSNPVRFKANLLKKGFSEVEAEELAALGEAGQLSGAIAESYRSGRVRGDAGTSGRVALAANDPGLVDVESFTPTRAAVPSEFKALADSRGLVDDPELEALLRMLAEEE